jgi:hypothetical protein
MSDPTKRLLPVKDFMQLPDSMGDRDVRYELVEGQVVEIALEALQHNLVRDSVLMALHRYADGK